MIDRGEGNSWLSFVRSLVLQSVKNGAYSRMLLKLALID